jgi:uncharacterized protein YggU (UPF0235/DUF167 family)
VAESVDGMTGELTIAVRVKPGARRRHVGGRYDGPHGPALIVAVTDPPVDGRATEAALRAVAAALGVRRADVTLRLGDTSRDKLLRVDGPPDDLLARLRALRDTGDGPG